MPNRTLSDTLKMSGVEVEQVCGIEIRKMKVKDYQRFMIKGGALLPALMDALFPGMSTIEIITSVATSKTEVFAELLIQAPELAIEALATLLDVDMEQLGECTLSELREIAEAWTRLNVDDVKDFFDFVAGLFRHP